MLKGISPVLMHHNHEGRDEQRKGVELMKTIKDKYLLVVAAYVYFYNWLGGTP